MKYIIIGVMSLLTGMLLGGIGPRWDLAKAQDRIKTLELSQKNIHSDSEGFSGIRQMLKLTDKDAVRNAPPIRKAKRLVDATNVVASVSVSSGDANKPSEAQSPVTNSSSMEEQVETASKIWASRVEIARNNFASNSGLKKEEIEIFDTAMEAMNIRLEYSISQWVDKMKDKDQISSEDGVRMLNELSDALVVGYDDMDKALPAGWREKSGLDFEIMNFIDPAVAKPLVALEDKMPGRGEHQWGAQRRRHSNSKGSAGPVDFDVEVNVEK